MAILMDWTLEESSEEKGLSQPCLLEKLSPIRIAKKIKGLQ